MISSNIVFVDNGGSGSSGTSGFWHFDFNVFHVLIFWHLHQLITNGCGRGDFLFIIVYLLLLVFINAKPVSYDGWKYHSIDIFAQNRDGLAWKWLFLQGFDLEWMVSILKWMHKCIIIQCNFVYRETKFYVRCKI